VYESHRQNVPILGGKFQPVSFCVPMIDRYIPHAMDHAISQFALRPCLASFGIAVCIRDTPCVLFRGLGIGKTGTSQNPSYLYKQVQRIPLTASKLIETLDDPDSGTLWRVIFREL
jgi:hypothetical protein